MTFPETKVSELWMTEAIVWTVCAAGAFFGIALLWGIAEILLGTGTNRRKRDPGLNAFQQPLGRDD